MSDKSKATEDMLAVLHGKMAEAMKSKLESPDTLTASDLNVIRQFLKDNGIQADGSKTPGMQSLVDGLPDLPDNDDHLYAH